MLIFKANVYKFNRAVNGVATALKVGGGGYAWIQKPEKAVRKMLII